MNRQAFTPIDSIKYIWDGLGLPSGAVKSVTLQGEGLGVPSSFKIGHLAQSSIALSALAAALVQSLRQHRDVPKVTVPLDHAVVEFQSESLYLLDGEPPPSTWGPLGGLHKTADGYIRMHDSFTNHRNAALETLGLSLDATKEDVAKKILEWSALQLETKALRNKAAIYALRSYEEWDALPQSGAIADFPILLRKLSDGPPGLSKRMLTKDPDKCLRGLRVLEMSRVIAAPVSGKTLAAHGAEVIWVTSPNLPDLPNLDRDLSRGKRTVQLDIRQPGDKSILLDLVQNADVFIQGYRPGSLAANGLSPAELIALNPSLIIANLSAFGPNGPWSGNRGFDSLVQTCSGMNISEAEHFRDGGPARATPCQALDHGAGYLLATGILAALYKRAAFGGSYEIDVSLAGVMKYLRSLGQYVGDTGFQCQNVTESRDLEQYMETRTSAFGELKAVRHSALIEEVEVGWDVMPKPLGSDEGKWLD